jgi:hypothetical protein
VVQTSKLSWETRGHRRRSRSVPPSKYITKKM